VTLIRFRRTLKRGENESDRAINPHLESNIIWAHGPLRPRASGAKGEQGGQGLRHARARVPRHTPGTSRTAPQRAVTEAGPGSLWQGHLISRQGSQDLVLFRDSHGVAVLASPWPGGMRRGK